MMPPPDMIQRFNLTSRCAHWANAAGFLALLITGVFIFLRRPLGLGADTTNIFLHAHISAAIVYVAGPTLSWIIGDSASWRQWVRDAFDWRLRDLKWLALMPIHLFNSRVALPPQGRFNAGQRINIWTQVLLKAIFLITGIVLLARHGQLGMLYIHLLCAAVAILFFMGHIYMSVINPDTRHSLRGIIAGWIEVQWARHHHLLWVERHETAKKGSAPSADDGDNKVDKSG